jgi:putative spermidine/putrescine transport system ATP-binding protein
MTVHGSKLSVEGVEKRYGNFTALHATDLDIRPGEFFSIIGPSGSGKTTLLGLIAGFIPASGGRIALDDVDIAGLPPYRRNLGMVFQQYALFPHMTVFENVAFPLRLRGASAGEITRRVGEMLATVRLESVGQRKPHQLSGGQQQRIALARAAVYDPRLLLMDEPLGALDKNLREDMQFEIKAFHRRMGATVIYVTHDQDEATTMSDRIAIMHGGRVEQCGAPRHLYEHPRNAFVASFLGSANLLRVDDIDVAPDGSFHARTVDGKVLRGGWASADGGRGSPHVVCVRPEAITIAAYPAAAGASDGFNTMDGTIIEAVYTAGTFRYRVAVANAEPVLVRLPSVHKSSMFERGQHVQIAWPMQSSLLIPEK